MPNVENYAILARIIRVEADVKHSMQKPKTVDEAYRSTNFSRYSARAALP
jgi:hypothetical protein